MASFLTLKEAFTWHNAEMLTKKDVYGIISGEKAYTESSMRGGNKDETSFVSRFGRNDKE